MYLIAEFDLCRIVIEESGANVFAVTYNESGGVTRTKEGGFLRTDLC